MPNHCNNELHITGTKSELDRLQKAARGYWPWARPEMDTVDDGLKEIEFAATNFIVPSAAAVDDYQKIGYNWCSNVLGTKWGAYDITISRSTRDLHYSFQTAWGPFNMAVIVAISMRFPQLTFVYEWDEPGMGFDGVATIKRGVVSGRLETSGKEYTGRLTGGPDDSED